MFNLNIKKSDIIYWFFLTICFFPFLNILRLPTDNQPNALIFSFFIVFLNYKTLIYHFPAKIIYFILIFVVAFILLLLSDMSITSILSFSGYISILFIPLAVFISLYKIGGLPKKFIFVIISIWGIVAFIQRFFFTNFLSFLLYRNSGSGLMGRGVNSLAPEPTFYGSVLILFFIIFIINYKINKNKIYITFIFSQLFLLSLSTTSFAILLCSFIFYLIVIIFFRKFNINFILILLFILFTIIIFIILFDNSIKTMRFYKIANLVINNPQLILIDESINERLNHALLPIINFFEHYGIPMGYNNFQEYIIYKTNDASYNFLFKNINIDHYKRIMSGYGAIIFELGLFAFLIPYYIYTIFKPILYNNNYLFIFILFNLLLFTSMTFNNSMILFVLGNVLYLQQNNYTVSD